MCTEYHLQWFPSSTQEDGERLIKQEDESPDTVLCGYLGCAVEMNLYLEVLLHRKKEKVGKKIVEVKKIKAVWKAKRPL